MFKRKKIAGLVLVVIVGLGVGLGSLSMADSSDGAVSNHDDVAVEDSDPQDIVVGGHPGSCGYQWDAEREGWHRPWDPDSFIPAEEKPDWNDFIPDADGNGPDVLDNGEWILKTMGDQNNPQNVLDGTQITLALIKNEDGSGFSLRGSAGCNSYFGSFDMTDDGITVGPIASTEMWCGNEDVMGQEFQFLQALGNVQGYRINGDSLELSYDGGVLMFAVH